MRVLVCGGRNFFSYPIVQMVLDRIHITELCHGGAVGAESLAASYAKANDINVFLSKELSTRFEKQVDVVVCFPGGEQTNKIKEEAQSRCIPCLCYNDKGLLIEIE